MPMTSFTIREASAADVPALVALLQDEHMRTEGVLDFGTRYWLAETPDSATVGLIGVEYAIGAALVRSALVRADLRGQGIGAALLARALESAAGQRIYLFSTDAGTYWVQQGFVEVSVSEVVDALPNAPQVVLFDELGWLRTEVAYRFMPSPPGPSPAHGSGS
jgi:N-acetylglutamate synthase-like GNAT family acetyltransferase